AGSAGTGLRARGGLRTHDRLPVVNESAIAGEAVGLDQMVRVAVVQEGVAAPALAPERGGLVMPARAAFAVTVLRGYQVASSLCGQHDDFYAPLYHFNWTASTEIGPFLVGSRALRLACLAKGGL